MSEQTEKASQKPRKAPAGKRAPRKARPSGKSATEAGRKSAKGKPRAQKPQGKTTPAKTGQDETGQDETGHAKASPQDKNTPAKTPGGKDQTTEAQAPNPATIVFGSNRPIVAPPPPKPVSSGLRFTGPSDGILKSSGPQTTSPKADGLTFATAKNEEAKAPPTAPKPETLAAKKSAGAEPERKAAPENKQKNAADTSPPASAKAKPDPAKSKTKSTPGKTRVNKTVGDKADTKKTKTPPKPSGPTKPAIAPQNHGPLIEKAPSRAPLAAALACLGIAAVALVWWLDSLPAPQTGPQIARGERDASSGQGSGASQPSPGTGDIANTAEAPPVQTPAQPASAETRNPEAAMQEAAAPDPAAVGAQTADTQISVAEIEEIQSLLGKIGLSAGAGKGELTDATRAAIRDYQTMAGLPVDGEATPALLEELRAVASLYGG